MKLAALNKFNIFAIPEFFVPLMSLAHWCYMILSYLIFLYNKNVFGN